MLDHSPPPPAKTAAAIVEKYFVCTTNCSNGQICLSKRCSNNLHSCCPARSNVGWSLAGDALSAASKKIKIKYKKKKTPSVWSILRFLDLVGGGSITGVSHMVGKASEGKYMKHYSNRANEPLILNTGKCVEIKGLCYDLSFLGGFFWRGKPNTIGK